MQWTILILYMTRKQRQRIRDEAEWEIFSQRRVFVLLRKLLTPRSTLRKDQTSTKTTKKDWYLCIENIQRVMVQCNRVQGQFAKLVSAWNSQEHSSGFVSDNTRWEGLLWRHV